MDVDAQTTYLEYNIRIAQEGARFVAYVSRDGGLVEHNGHASEIWATASCVNADRAIWVARNAIDSDKVR